MNLRRVAVRPDSWLSSPSAGKGLGPKTSDGPQCTCFVLVRKFFFRSRPNDRSGPCPGPDAAACRRWHPPRRCGPQEAGPTGGDHDRHDRTETCAPAETEPPRLHRLRPLRRGGLRRDRHRRHGDGPGRPAAGGLTRKVLSQTDGPAPGYVTIIAEVEISPGAVVAPTLIPASRRAMCWRARWSCPSRASAPATSSRRRFPGPAGTVHGGGKASTGKVKIVSTFVVEKAKPLASRPDPYALWNSFNSDRRWAREARCRTARFRRRGTSSRGPAHECSARRRLLLALSARQGRDPYRKLTSEGVRVETILGKEVLVVEREAIRLLSEQPSSTSTTSCAPAISRSSAASSTTPRRPRTTSSSPMTS